MRAQDKSCVGTFVMQIRVNRGSEVPLREQVAEQIILQIVTEELKPGEVLPSVRELARRLKIHHNTVSHAYRDLVRRHWLAGRRGVACWFDNRTHSQTGWAARGAISTI